MLVLDPSWPQWPLDVTQTQTMLGMYAATARYEQEHQLQQQTAAAEKLLEFEFTGGCVRQGFVPSFGVAPRPRVS